MTHRRLPFWLFLLAFLSACQDESGQSSGELKVYRHSMDGAPTNLDPAKSASVYANFIIINLYDTLYSYRYLARPYAIKPNLAAAMPVVSDDGLTYLISLKQGARFIDDPVFPGGSGREVTAADVVYSLKRHFDPAVRSQGAWLWQGKIQGLDEWKAAGADYEVEVSGLTAVDRHTLRIRLNQPFPQLIYTLATGFSAVVPNEAASHYGPELSVHPVGSGPFRLLEFDTTHALLAANPGFRQEPVDLVDEGFVPSRDGVFGVEAISGRAPPFVDQVDIQFVQEDAARWSSFTKEGEIQYIRTPKDQVDQVLESKDPISLRAEYADRFHLFTGLESAFVHIDMNMNDPSIGYAADPTRNQRNRDLRCAIRKAFDWDERNRIFYSELGLVFPGVIPPVVSEFDPNQERSSVIYDPQGAKQLLADAGWTAETLPVLEYGMQAGVTQNHGFEQFRGQLGRIGYPSEKITKKVFATFGDYSRAYKQGQVQIMQLAWYLDYPDAENALQLFYGPNAAPGSNGSNFNDAEYDDLYRQAATLPPSKQRTEIYRRMNQILIDECVTISGISRRSIFLLHKDVVAVPDRYILGGFFLRYVDLK
jgi:ABC-type transport system substrate-binding protein